MKYKYIFLIVLSLNNILTLLADNVTIEIDRYIYTSSFIIYIIIYKYSCI